MTGVSTDESDPWARYRAAGLAVEQFEPLKSAEGPVDVARATGRSSRALTDRSATLRTAPNAATERLRQP